MLINNKDLSEEVVLNNIKHLQKDQSIEIKGNRLYEVAFVRTDGNSFTWMKDLQLLDKSGKVVQNPKSSASFTPNEILRMIKHALDAQCIVTIS